MGATTVIYREAPYFSRSYQAHFESSTAPQLTGHLSLTLAPAHSVHIFFPPCIISNNFKNQKQTYVINYKGRQPMIPGY